MEKCEILGCNKEAKVKVIEISTGIERKVCSDHIKDVNLMTLKQGKK